MPRKTVDLSALESLRECGDYDKIAVALTDEWQSAPEFEDDPIRARMLAAELAARGAKIEEMEAALAPYLERVDRVPYGMAARVLLMLGMYHYRRDEPSEAIRLSQLSENVAAARDDEFTKGEAVQLQGQALWALERWEEAASCFEQAIGIYAGGSRSYRLSLAYLCLGAVQSRMGNVEEARVTLERSIKILLKSQDAYNLAVARVNVASALNALGEHETAHKYLLFANDTFERIGHEQFSYLTLNGIASTLVSLREYDAALEMLKQALEKGVKARSTMIASTYEIKARVYLAKRDWVGAEKALSAATEIAEQANSQSQKCEVRRTLGRFYIAQERYEEAAAVLLAALEIAQELQASLTELEVKALLAQAVCGTNPVDACKLLSDVEAGLVTRPLPELKKEAQAARKRIGALDQEQYFILSDDRIPLLAEAKIALLKWLWARALHRARGNARQAASILGVTPTYIRKLTKVIPRDLLRPGRKRSKKKERAAVL